MTDRLVDMLSSHVTEMHPEYELDHEAYQASGHRIQSPVEPCNICGRKVYLLLAKGRTRPVWVQLGELKGKDTLFPYGEQKRHECGDGDSWSVEAALFAQEAMAEWGIR